jgi:hypothetical protein
MKTIYDLGLHDEIQLEKYLWIQRVAGGWIYRYESESGAGGWHITTQFVPFDNEFMVKD